MTLPNPFSPTSTPEDKVHPKPKDETTEVVSEAQQAMDERRTFDDPQTQPVAPPPEGEKHDHLAEREAKAEDRQEALLDEAIEETFPGSDPISPKHIT